MKSGGLLGGQQQEPQMILKSEFASMDDDERYSKEYIPYSMITPEPRRNTSETSKLGRPRIVGFARHFGRGKNGAECKGLIGTVETKESVEVAGQSQRRKS